MRIVFIICNWIGGDISQIWRNVHFYCIGVLHRVTTTNDNKQLEARRRRGWVTGIDCTGSDAGAPCTGLCTGNDIRAPGKQIIAETNPVVSRSIDTSISIIVRIHTSISFFFSNCLSEWFHRFDFFFVVFFDVISLLRWDESF